MIARDHMASRARRAKIVSIDLVADWHAEVPAGTFEPEPGLIALDQLRRAMERLEQLPPRYREVVRLRKMKD